MRISKLISLAGLSVALSATASAQFSVSGGGSLIPTSGTGGTGAVYDTTMPATPASSTVVVGQAVTSIQSIQISGLAHTWVGDTQATLADPAGVQHLIWLRPGFLNTSNFGNSGDFDGGNYTFVGDGSGANLPTSSIAATVPAGTYNQTFASGGTTWVSGTNGINNTPMGSITGAAGTWTLTIYDWAGGDTGSFTGWTLNGNGGASNSGASYCDGTTGVACPCATPGLAGEGCVNSSGSGCSITGSGNAAVGSDTFTLTIAGGPAGKPGLFFQGTNQVNVLNAGGIVCSNSNLRYGVLVLDGSGGGVGTGFGANTTAGSSMNYQFWYRDPGFSCNGDFNFSNGWAVTWN